MIDQDLLQRRLDRLPLWVTLLALILIACRLGDRFVGDSMDSFFILIEVTAALVILAMVALAAPVHRRLMDVRTEAAKRADAERRAVEQLLQMTNLLQSARGATDAYLVLQATSENLLPGFGGGLYVFNNSRDRLELSACWNWPEDTQLNSTLSPDSCWALKRGKRHLNRPGEGVIRCEHHDTSLDVLEIPMMAHGEIQGMLNLTPPPGRDRAALEAITDTAEALTDAMSLAVSSIRLRETLRHQALRDPLTGLYNRRYMQDTLERLSAVSDRTSSSLAVIMIDLDHFKKLNDEHGHATGDAVLRDVASALITSMRSGDVACRYGGEELVVLLPECELEAALDRAEEMRARIEGLTERFGVPISASFGVAAMPETNRSPQAILTSADAALYEAKKSGRNRVVSAKSSSVVQMPAAAE